MKSDSSFVRFWGLTVKDCLSRLGSSEEGLSRSEAEARLSRFGSNRLSHQKESTDLGLFVSQFKSPIILLLFFASVLSFLLRDSADGVVILSIVFLSGALGFWQERGAMHAVQKLLAIVQVRTTVLRDSEPTEVPVEDVVPGDILILNAGDIIPADSLIISSRDLFVNEASLTGETFPVEKSAKVLSETSALSERNNSLWMGTHVISGQARAVSVKTGKDTEFGKISDRLKLRPMETEFEIGIRKFGFFLLHVTLLLVIAIFVVNVFLHKPVLESFLFSLALAVGLTPQLLPAIISVNLSHGAKRMAENRVIVKRLAAIENFGNMNVICSDKTGTLTEGNVKLRSALNVYGEEENDVAWNAFLNASFETGFVNAIDQSIRTDLNFDLSGYEKTDEIPYDFLRKRLSIAVAHNGSHRMVTKGALINILEVCGFVSSPDGSRVAIDSLKERILQTYERLGKEGNRVLGVAVKELGAVSKIEKSEEENMVFLGFLSFYDPPKINVEKTVQDLKNLGVSLKVITGDNRYVATNLCHKLGFENPNILCGPDLEEISNEALVQRVNEVDVFAEIEPNSKERIVIALKKGGNVVGYLGDGINDVAALHSADVGISVDGAVDVAKNAADLVLLEKNLAVLVEGVKQGRKTFANTLKYVFMATSANFGNMFSMAGISLFLPFLPLLPKQILLINFLTDFPEMTIATDRVDEEMISSPKRWDIAAIRKFMVVFGMISSFFDYLTFGVLYWFLKVGNDQFRTGWFLESIVSASMIVLIIRTRNSFFRSIPGRPLFWATIGIGCFTVLLPYTPIAGLFELVPLPANVLLILLGIVTIYATTAEIAKKLFYRKVRI
ncbi:magnesium-translocating P-type ATPase [Leptospira ellisii]|uniref:Magnesium-transporting ATPase, P-type 1 n=3 Tax=Leptospira ellisii TaxID=2023197 RepID=A0AAE4QLZ7_9LEPT|nr:magnesium-translocating P-type ATPase [Leptospira ellisii]MDV6235082.1 magnesium-translocating P-type ATPase [Leptospira ellisii]